MRRLALAVSAALTAVLAVTVAPAHSSTSVSVFNNYFAPNPATIEPGHDVTWTWACDSYSGGCAATHNVTAYQGASFASSNLSYPASYTASMPSTATTVKYRCTLHSSLSGTQCTGMCGVLGTDTQKPTATLDSPRENQVVTGAGLTVPVSFAGGATDDVGVTSVTVRVYDLIGARKDFPASCAGGCGASSVTWTAQASLAPGTYLAEVAASDGLGNSNTAASTRIRFFVL